MECSRKTKGAYVKNMQWWLLLILLLSVASIRKNCNIRHGSFKNQFNSKQFIESEIERRYRKWSQSWLQTSLHRPLCANGDYLYFYQIYSPQLETLGAFKIVIFRFTILKLGSLNRKLYVILKLVSILKIRLQTSL